MAKKTNATIDIVKVDIKTLINKLTTAFADEWMASYQYWICAKIAQGKLRTAVAAEMAQHAQEEMAHATMLADRILQLGGTIKLYPKDWHTVGGCSYDAIKSPEITKILTENIKGEQCAIEYYNNLLKFVEGKDIVTYNIILKILTDEIEHEQDLMQLLEDVSA